MISLTIKANGSKCFLELKKEDTLQLEVAMLIYEMEQVKLQLLDLVFDGDVSVESDE